MPIFLRVYIINFWANSPLICCFLSVDKKNHSRVIKVRSMSELCTKDHVRGYDSRSYLKDCGIRISLDFKNQKLYLISDYKVYTKVPTHLENPWNPGIVREVKNSQGEKNPQQFGKLCSLKQFFFKQLLSSLKYIRSFFYLYHCILYTIYQNLKMSSIFNILNVYGEGNVFIYSTWISQI